MEKERKKEVLYLAYDTETTGLPEDYNADPFDTANWPRVYQLGAILFDEMGFEHGRVNSYIKPNGWKIPVVDDFLRSLGTVDFHEEQGITTEMLMDVGRPMYEVMAEFVELANRCDAKVCHNASFDYPIITCEMFRVKHFPGSWDLKPQYCTKLLSEDICKIPGYKGKYKWPTLQEAYTFFYGEEFQGAHDAMADVQATVDIFLEIKQIKNLDYVNS